MTVHSFDGSLNEVFGLMTTSLTSTNCVAASLFSPLFTGAECGGMLRGTSAFEDVIKTVCTTNCDWRNTKRMVERLCVIGDGDFPTPVQVLEQSERRLARTTSCGYRARTIRIIADQTAQGKLPLDAWAGAGDFSRIKDALMPIWGIGPYALHHIMVLLGDYSTIPVDSEVLKYLRATHFDGRKVSERVAVRPYERFGEHRYLAFKFGRVAHALSHSS